MAQRRILAGIFLFSLSSLAYEILLTRIFSISLWYHFAFMVISIAMLGIGASGTALSVFPMLKAAPNHESVSRRIGLYGLLLGMSITLSYLISNQIPFDPVRLSWDRVQLLYICLYYIILSVPFFFFGLGASTAFSALSDSSGLLYGADLLGAGAGSMMILSLMSVMAPQYGVVIASSFALIGVIVNGGNKTRLACALLILFNIGLFFTPGLISPRMSQYKGFQLAMQHPGAERIGTYYSPFSRIDTFRSPAVRFAPGLSLRYLDPLPEQTGISIDGGEVNAVTDVRNKEPLRFLKYLPSALPYTLAGRKDVLVLEPKGGLEALVAGQYRTENVYKVDSDPLVIRTIRDEFRNLSGGIYDNKTWTGMGRSWLRARNDKFDLIDIPMTGASPSGSFGIAEDYKFTVEAFEEYLRHLKDDGVLSINLFILPPPRTELRLLSTIVTAMEEMGIKDADGRIISIRSWGTICIIAKKRPFAPEEIESARNFSKEMRFDLVYLPGISAAEANVYVKMSSNDYFNAFRSILDPSARRSFQRTYLFDIAPAHDETPFFNYYLKLGNLKKIYEVMGGKWQYFIEEGYILPVVFIQVFLLSLTLIVLPLPFMKNRVKVRRVLAGDDLTDQSLTGEGREVTPPLSGDNIGRGSMIYFALLGTGFMFVEISLIQKMILPMENPSYAAATVLTSLLIGSGVGSVLGTKLPIMRNRFTVALLSVLIVACSLFLPSIVDIISSYTLIMKILCAFLFLAPLSLLMGIPFPLGIRNLGRLNPGMIPWAWAINGCLSVLAPLLCIMLAMMTGFKVVLWLGAVAYMLAFLLFPGRSPQISR